PPTPWRRYGSPAPPPAAAAGGPRGPAAPGGSRTPATAAGRPRTAARPPAPLRCRRRPSGNDTAGVRPILAARGKASGAAAHRFRSVGAVLYATDTATASRRPRYPIAGRWA